MTFESFFADIETQYVNDVRLRPSDVAALTAWQLQQPHLPAPLHPIETALFLQCCNFDTTATQRRIDAFFTFRTRHPQFFANLDINGASIQATLDAWILAMLPTPTPDGCHVFYLRMRDANPAALNVDHLVKLCDMFVGVMMKRVGGAVGGHIFIVDLQHAQLAHLLKLCRHVGSLRRALTYAQTVAPLRVKSLHYVNGAPLIERLLAIARRFLNRQWQDMLHVHYADNATICAHVPKRMLPIECGGDAFNATAYYDDAVRPQLETFAEYFAHDERRLVDETKRPPPHPIKKSYLFGRKSH